MEGSGAGDPFANSAHFPMPTSAHPRGDGLESATAAANRQPTSDGSYNPFGFSEREPLSSTGHRTPEPVSQPMFQPLAFHVPDESWDAFEQMQQQQPTPQPVGTPALDPQGIEPGSQPLPPGPAFPPTQALRGLPPRGRGERRASGPGLDGSPPQTPSSAVGPVPPTLVRPVVVDGISTDLLNKWFAEADEDLDGRVAGEEARRFFRRTGLPHPALRKVSKHTWSP
ncbi:hypothetical protein WJX84_008618, partial [Apatococcus fuscideae]